MSQPTAIDRYAQAVRAQMDAAIATQRPALEAAAEAVAAALTAGRFVYAFGTGHSHMLAEEIFYRAGGLARAAAILDPPLMLHEAASEGSKREQQPGVAAAVLGRYPVQAGDVLVVASNSGRNAVPVEMAVEGRRRGLRVIAITSLAHSRAFPSRHPSGKRLFELADVVLDNQAVPGDAVVGIPGTPRNAGPTSTLTGVLLVNSLILRAIELTAACGQAPEIYASSNADVPGWNEALLAKYRPQIRHL